MGHVNTVTAAFCLRIDCRPRQPAVFSMAMLQLTRSSPNGAPDEAPESFYKFALFACHNYRALRKMCGRLIGGLVNGINVCACVAARAV